ncbi:MAG TPA: diacylglycerol kinase family protein [Candidatus Kapabacteria bacterium]
MRSLPYFFIYNPKCGSPRTRAIAERIRRSVESRFPWNVTTRPEEASRLAREAAHRGAEIIVAAGGDGTVHEVLNGIMESDRQSRPALGMLPLGNGNDFAFAAGVPKDPVAALDVLMRAQSRIVDVGRIESERGTAKYWINTCGIGLNASVALRARQFNGNNQWKYLAASLAAIWNDSRSLDLSITLDRLRSHRECSLITLGNGCREGGAFLMTPEARIDDGRFDMLIVKPLPRWRLLMLLPRARKGSHIRSAAVSISPCASAEILSQTPLAIHTDGEIFVKPEDHITKITVQLLPNALRVIA